MVRSSEPHWSAFHKKGKYDSHGNPLIPTVRIHEKPTQGSHDMFTLNDDVLGYGSQHLDL